MKNKKALYILIPLVVIVWGNFIYQMYTGLHSPDDIVMPQANEETYASDNSFQPDTFSLVNNYRDPFLGKTIREPGPRPNQSSVINRKSPIVTLWPSIIYSGVIKNQKSKKEVAMVQINGQSNLMKVKDVVSEVQLLKIYKDSIEVKFGKEKRVIRK